MKLKTLDIIILSAAALLLFTGMASTNFTDILKTFIPSVEGFSSVPIWDVRQWSWGYGSPAGYDRNKKPAGTITRARAFTEMMKIVDQHYRELKPLVKKQLNGRQWAALLSFSYNVGTGGAKKIIETINGADTAAVVARMSKYIYADGKVSNGLITRRRKETDLYQGLQVFGRGPAVEVQPDILPEVVEFISPDRISNFPY